MKNEKESTTSAGERPDGRTAGTPHTARPGSPARQPFGPNGRSTPPTERILPVEIVDRQGRSYTLQTDEGLRVKIDESVITANGLCIDARAGQLLAPESLVRRLFEPARRAREQRQWELFADAVPLIWRHRRRILADPQLAAVLTPMRVVAAYTAIRHGGPYTLEMVIRAWTEHEEVYTCTCPKCGGRMVIYSFAGSPLSGRSSHSAVCTACGCRQLHVDGGNFGRLTAPFVRMASRSGRPPEGGAPSLEEAIERIRRFEAPDQPTR